MSSPKSARITAEDAAHIADQLEAGRTMEYEGYQGYFDVVEFKDGLFYQQAMQWEQLTAADRTNGVQGVDRETFVRSLIGKKHGIWWDWLRRD